jgi:NAD+-dependent protein deacetylase sirtuin 6
LVIVNLQATVKDKKASLVIHAESDRVMRRVAQHLRLRIPEYIRVDRLRVKYEPSVASFAIRVVNIDDEDAPIPWLDRIDLRFSSPQDDVLLSSETVALKSPFVHHMRQLQLPVTDALLVVHMTFHFAEGCTERPVSKRHSMSLVKTEEVRYEFTTIVERYEQENEEDDGQVSC